MRPTSARLLAFAALALLALPGFGQTPAAAAPPEPPAGALVLQRDPLPGVRTGGVPKDPGIYRALVEQGFRTFVDLRSDGELPADLEATVGAAGLTYERVPVAGEGGLDLVAARALDALLDDPARRPIVVACSSGNRVGALMAVQAFWLDGVPPEEALALGKRAGLTRLEPSVRLLLGLPAAPESPAKPEPPRR